MGEIGRETERAGKEGSCEYRVERPNQQVAQKAAISLSQAIRYETVTGNLSEIDRFRAFLRAKYPTVFTRAVELKTDSHSLLLKWPARTRDEQEKLPVLFCAHMDVVPAGDNWQYPPFAGEIVLEHIHGRGAIDCKNVIIALLEAAEYLARHGFLPARDIYFAFGHDEETGGRKGASSIARIFEQHNLRFEMVLDEGEHITTSLTGNRARPTAVISVAEKGFLNLRITAHARGGHSSVPPKDTPASVIAEAVCRLRFARERQRIIPLTRRYFSAIIPLMEYRMRFSYALAPVFAGQFYREIRGDNKLHALISDTYTATMLSGAIAANILPHEATATINARLLPGTSCDDAIAHIKRTTLGLGLEYAVLAAYEPSKISSASSEMFLLLDKIIKARYGAEVVTAPGLMTGGSDARRYEPFCDNVYRFMPFYLSGRTAKRMHAANECISVNALGAAVEFYKVLFELL